MTKPPDKSKIVRKLRCAVYTRKSSEEGLEQEFNSLHAQREACEAYIASQRSEGWALVRDQYDDGGISGGTLERPGLKRLLADIEDGLVDVVVVYKIDRLSRSLAELCQLLTVDNLHAYNLRLDGCVYRRHEVHDADLGVRREWLGGRRRWNRRDSRRTSCSSDERGEHRPVLGADLVACEERVLPREGDGADLVLDQVGVEFECRRR